MVGPDQRAGGHERRAPRDIEVLGPYPTRQAAEDWQATNKARNESWDAEDERWEGGDTPEG